MFISFVLSALIVLSTAPLGITHLYRLETDFQWNQIILDNVAIQLGKQGRELLNQIRKVEIQLEKLHTLYHAALACSLIPATAIACKSSAHNLRTTIQVIATSVIPSASARWLQSVQQARRDLNKGSQDLGMDTVVDFHPTARFCKVCHQVEGWKVPSKVLPAFLFSKRINVLKSRLVHEKQKNGLWNYRLRAH
ncbi:hypothetical protein EBR03_05155 [bacterium]|nr:hypothetical protein [bacterium]